MGAGQADADRERRFEDYVEVLGSMLGHADREEPFHQYVTGLLLPGDRKSVEPMAARVAPARVSAEHQSMLHFVGVSPWDGQAFLEGVADQVLPALAKAGTIEAWIVDDTGFPKKGKHSVGVARQYCGQLGKQDNCQVAVSLSVANEHASLPVAWRLYLPEDWAADKVRRKKAKVPADIPFRTKPEIALEQVWDALARGVAPGVILADPAYGTNMAFRQGVTALGLSYAMGILSTTIVWAPGTGPLPPAPRTGRGRPSRNLRRAPGHQPMSVKDLALSLGPDAWRPVSWREGSNQVLASRFARLRVRPAYNDDKRSEQWPEEWLLIEWPEDEDAPTKYWLSTLSEDISLQRLVFVTKMRWRIERDYRELKQELGLGHFEGRGWLGFHHHAALCIAAYGFLVRERIAFPPCGERCSLVGKEPPLPQGYRPRGASDPARAA